MIRKKIKKNPFASPCVWLVGHYSFTVLTPRTRLATNRSELPSDLSLNLL